MLSFPVSVSILQPVLSPKPPPPSLSHTHARAHTRTHTFFPRLQSQIHKPGVRSKLREGVEIGTDGQTQTNQRDSQPFHGAVLPSRAVFAGEEARKGKGRRAKTKERRVTSLACVLTPKAARSLQPCGDPQGRFLPPFPPPPSQGGPRENEKSRSLRRRARRFRQRNKLGLAQVRGAEGGEVARQRP